MKSLIAKRSVQIDGRKTSVSLEAAFWDVLREVAGRSRITVSELISRINQERRSSNLSSALRLFALDACRNGSQSEQLRTTDEVSIQGTPDARSYGRVVGVEG